MVYISLRLVGEETDTLFHMIKLDPQTHFDDLSKKIKSLTRIAPDNQHIELRGERISNSDNPLKLVNDHEELVVKHTELPLWQVYKSAVDTAMKPGPKRIESAKEAVEIHEKLMEKRFFEAYATFAMFRLTHHYDVAAWADESTESMKEAALNYFRALHYQRGAKNESDFLCTFEPRPRHFGGSRKNTLAFVQLHGESEITKYNIKCHHFESSGQRARGLRPDIKEIFLYIFLHLINVGPHAHFFIPELTVNKTSMYIATKWCDNFVPLSKIDKEAINVEVLVQILLLEAFMFIDDLHMDNVGVWKDTKEVAIVDFIAKGPFTYSNVKKVFLRDGSVYWEDFHIEAFKNCDEKMRIHLAKEYLTKWNIFAKLDLAYEQIKAEKDVMKQQGIDPEDCNTSIDEIDHFITIVKRNLTKLMDILNNEE